jgi:hypothetical protein
MFILTFQKLGKIVDRVYTPVNNSFGQENDSKTSENPAQTMHFLIRLIANGEMSALIEMLKIGKQYK